MRVGTAGGVEGPRALDRWPEVYCLAGHKHEDSGQWVGAVSS